MPETQIPPQNPSQTSLFFFEMQEKSDPKRPSWPFFVPSLEPWWGYHGVTGSLSLVPPCGAGGSSAQSSCSNIWFPNGKPGVPRHSWPYDTRRRKPLDFPCAGRKYFARKGNKKAKRGGERERNPGRGSRCEGSCGHSISKSKSQLEVWELVSTAQGKAAPSVPRGSQGSPSSAPMAGTGTKPPGEGAWESSGQRFRHATPQRMQRKRANAYRDPTPTPCPSPDPSGWTF